MTDKLSDAKAILDKHEALTQEPPTGDIGKAFQEVRSELVAAGRKFEQQVERLEDALEHCGYDPADCIDCGGPPHKEWCRFWKLRDIVPILFASLEPVSEQVPQRPREAGEEESSEQDA